MSKITIGLDVGGTKIIGIALDENNSNLGVVKKNTQAFVGVEAVIQRIESVVTAVLKKSGKKIADLAGIGVGVPGLVDVKTGTILTAPNLGWEKVNLKKLLESKFKCFCQVENDVNAGIFAEYVLTLKKQPKHVVGMFVGTGIGGGIIINRELYYGAAGFAGEIGHMIINFEGKVCNCGNIGCLETVASKAGLMNKIQRDLGKKDLGRLEEYLESEDNFVLKSKHLKALIAEQNEYMLKRIKKMAKGLAAGILSVANLLNPEVIILGGGVIEALDDILLPKINKYLKQYPFNLAIKDLQLQVAALGDASVMLGAALLARENAQKQR